MSQAEDYRPLIRPVCLTLVSVIAMTAPLQRLAAAQSRADGCDLKHKLQRIVSDSEATGIAPRLKSRWQKPKLPPHILELLKQWSAEPDLAKRSRTLRDRIELEVNQELLPLGLESQLEEAEGGTLRARILPFPEGTPRSKLKGAHWLKKLATVHARRSPTHDIVVGLYDSSYAHYSAGKRETQLPWRAVYAEKMHTSGIHESVHYNQARVANVRDLWNDGRKSIDRQPIAVKITTETYPFEGGMADLANEQYGGAKGHMVEEYEATWREAKAAADDTIKQLKRLGVLTREIQSLPASRAPEAFAKLAEAADLLDETQLSLDFFRNRAEWVREFVQHDEPLLAQATARIEENPEAGFMPGKARMLVLIDPVFPDRITLHAGELKKRYPDIDLKTEGRPIVIQELKKLRTAMKERLEDLDGYDGLLANASKRIETLYRELDAATDRFIAP
jgi:hypothetical protein